MASFEEWKKKRNQQTTQTPSKPQVSFEAWKQRKQPQPIAQQQPLYKGGGGGGFNGTGAGKSFDKPNVGERALAALTGSANQAVFGISNALETTTEKFINSAIDRETEARKIIKEKGSKARHSATLFDKLIYLATNGKKADYSDSFSKQQLKSAENDINSVTQGMKPIPKTIIGGAVSAIPTAINLGAAYISGGAVNPLALAGLQGGGQSAYQAQKEGATTDQQFYSGLLGGSIEALTEKIPLDNLKNILGKQGKKGVVNYIKNIAVQSGIEYPSEFISQFAQTVADENIYRHDIGKNKTLSDFIKETAKESNLAGLQGAIGGGLLGGGASAINRFSNRTVKPIPPAKPQLPDLTKTKPQPQLIPYNTPKTTPNLPFNTAGNINARPIVENAVQGKNEGITNNIVKPVKAQQYENKVFNTTVKKMADILPIPRMVSKEFIKPSLSKLADEYYKTGKISEKTLNDVFETSYKESYVVSDEHYKQYKPLKDELRKTNIYISKEDSSSIADFIDFRKSNFGVLNVSRENGLPVDSYYQELTGRHPDLFPIDITHPADQLKRISEVAKGIVKTEADLNTYFGLGAKEFKRNARYEFDKAIESLKPELQITKRFIDEKSIPKALPKNIDVEKVKESYAKLAPLERNLAKTLRNNLMTNDDNIQVNRLLKNEITLDKLKDDINYPAIKAVYEAKKQINDLMGDVKQFNKERKSTLLNVAEKFLADVNSDNAHDTLTGFQQTVETMQRNTRVAFGESPQTEAMIDYYFNSIKNSVAKKNNLITEFNNRSKQNLNNQEQVYAEMYGEYEFYKSQITADNRQIKSNDYYKNLVEELEPKITEYYSKNNAKIDIKKVTTEVNTFRKMYDDLHTLINEAMIKTGQRPIEYRKGYFPHSKKNAPDTMLQRLADIVGIDLQVSDLPTDIAGRTETFKPNKPYASFTKSRTGTDTNYNLYENFDRYVNLAADLIYKTEHIQRLRALSEQIRYKHSDEQTKERISEIRNEQNVSDEEKQNRINEILQKPIGKLSHYVNNLEEYTNLLANKQSKLDRKFESDTKRAILNTSSALYNRVAGNMVAANPASALMNFIALGQGYSSIRTDSFINAVKDTVKIRNKDNFNAKSTFMTNRIGHERLSMTKTEKAKKVFGTPFTAIDSFVSEVIIRGKYYENVKSGMSEELALQEADKYAADVIADRSEGSMPTRFSAKNFVTRSYTMFNLEVNNQYRFLLKDLPRHQKAKGQAVLTGIAKFMFGQWLVSSALEKIVGYKPIFDPIGLIIEAVGDIFDEEDKKSDVFKKAGTSIIDNLPFVGGFLGGGRFPIENAIPNDLNPIAISQGKPTIIGSIAKGFNRKSRDTIKKELLKPLYYLALPFGGGQLKKMIQGSSAVNEKGSYSINSKGQNILQYPLPENAGAYTRALLFGKSSFPEAQNWVDSGFKSLSAKNTEIYKDLTNGGYKGAYSYIIDLNKAKKGSGGTDRVRNMLFENQDLTPFQKLDIDRKLTNLSSNINYSNRDTFTLSQLSDKKRGAYYTIKEKFPLSVSAYTTYLNMIDGLTKQDEIISGLKSTGMTYYEAYQFWKAVYGK